MAKNLIVNRNLKKIIEEDGHIQKAIAERSGMRRGTLSHILACKRPVYDDETLALPGALARRGGRGYNIFKHREVPGLLLWQTRFEDITPRFDIMS